MAVRADPTHQPHFTPQKHYFFNVPGKHQGLVRPEDIKFKNLPYWYRIMKKIGNYDTGEPTKAKLMNEI
jgi:hypothetical protein